MPKIRYIIALLLITATFWHFYGKTFTDDGLSGVTEDIQSDIERMMNHPDVISTIATLTEHIHQFIDRITDQQHDDTNPIHLRKPDLIQPDEQSFSIYNIEIGDRRQNVEVQVGSPKRVVQNEYHTEWVLYHDHYQHFMMVAYNEDDLVSGLYTNQDLLTSKQGITFSSTQDQVRTALGEPIEGIRKGWVRYQVQNENEYDLYQIDNQYVTIFYDTHENNTVTAIQIISKQLENQKEAFFGVPSEALKEGFEYVLFDLTNAVRVRKGLSVLDWEEPAQHTARMHSTDMANHQFFSHTNLNGESPSDRLMRDDIAFRMTGENLAAGQTSSIFAHEGLMNSLGHRENILHPDFKSLAVGVDFDDNSKQPYYTAVFLTK